MTAVHQDMWINQVEKMNSQMNPCSQKATEYLHYLLHDDPKSPLFAGSHQEFPIRKQLQEYLQEEKLCQDFHQRLQIWKVSDGSAQSGRKDLVQDPDSGHEPAGRK